MNQKKSKVVAALLAWFLGYFGAHRYYLGYKKRGVVMTIGAICEVIGTVLVSIASLTYIRYILDGEIALKNIALAGPSVAGLAMMIFGAVVAIMALVDFILILCGKLRPADGSDYISDERVAGREYKKSKAVAAVLAWFLGVFGAHRYYLGYKQRGIVMTAGGVCGILGSIFISVGGASALMNSGKYSRYYSGPDAFEIAMMVIGFAMIAFYSVIAIMAFIDFIRILCNSLTPADGSDWRNKQSNGRITAQPSQYIVDSLAAVDAFYRYNELLKDNLITQEDYEAKKNQLLGL